MPKFRITTPEGKTYEVTAPEGTTKDQALAYAKSHHQASARSNPIQDVIRGGISGLGNTLASVAGQVNPGLNMLDTFKSVGDVSNMIDQVRVGGKPKYNAPAMSPGQTSAAMLTNITGQNYNPETGAGRWSKAFGTMLPGALLPGSIPARIANVLGPTIGSEGAADVTRSMGGGENAQNIARMAGGIAGGLAVVPRVSVNRGGPPIPKPQARAASYLDRVVRSAKVTPETLAQADPRLTAAEAIGQPGQAALGALARQAGTTGDDLAGLVSARRVARPEVLKGEFADAVGIAPEAAAGDIQALVNAGRAKAAPLYDAAHDFGPVSSPRLESLSQRPSVRSALKAAINLAREEGQSPEELGLVHLDNMDSWATSNPAEVAATVKTPAGPARAPTQGKSLLKFLADSGGVSDAQGELAAVGAQSWHKGKAYQRPVIGSIDPDQAALMAQEAGYFPKYGPRPTERELFDAISQEMRGKPLFAREVDLKAADRYAASQAADEQAYYGHSGEDAPTMDAYGARPEPFSEPVYVPQPTAKTWDYVKRGLDQGLEKYRDKTTGKLHLDEAGRADLSTLQAIRSELVKLNPRYGEALSVSGDYLGAEAAFKDGGKLTFNSAITERQFAEKLAKLSESEREAFKGGIANRIFDLAQNDRLNPKVFRSPRIRQKLTLALGPDAANRLIATAQREAEMAAFENRYQPAGNSITAEMNAAMGDQADAFGSLLDNVGGVAKAVSEPKKSLLQGVGSLAQMGADYYRKPWSTAQRDFAGQQLMMSPQELAALIKQIQASKPKLTLGVSSTARPLSAAVAQELQSRRRVSQPAKSAR